MQNKKGFTLIELMVVVVIIGILAAVAVPKLFGMIAKSKASEVGPAAGTYVKVQLAYVNEKDSTGSWDVIGYQAPGTKSSAWLSATTTFTYADGHSAATTEEISSTAKVGWVAGNNVKLNECAKVTAPTAGSTGSTWTVKYSGTAGDAGSLAFASTVSGAGCEVLTPSFKTIK